MSNDQPPQGAAQRFIVEQMDLLLGRLDQLGRQIRDTVARIIGTTVAEAVSEAIRLALRLVPHRKNSSSGHDDWRYGESYDPYEDDGYGHQYQAERETYMPFTRPTWDWRRLMGRVVRLAAGTIVRIKSWKFARWLTVGGAAALEFMLLTPSTETTR